MQTILVIDDEAEIRFAIERILKKLDLQVISCENAALGIDIIKQNPNISLVISDVLMPGLNGVDLVKFVYETEANLPVILITGNPDLATAEAAVRYKAFDYISKPFERNQIVEQIRKALAHKLEKDIEKEKLLKAALMEDVLRSQNLDLNRQNSAILNATSDAIITVNKVGTIISANLSALENFRIESPLDLIGNNVKILFPPNKVGFYTKETNRLFTVHSTYTALQLNDVTLRKFDGSEFSADVSVCAYKLDQNIFFTGIIRDVTQKKEMVRRLIDSERRAFLSTLAASIGHEINNSLTAIQGYLEMALKDMASIEIKEKALKVSMNQAQKLQSLTANLLHLGKSDRLKKEDSSILELNSAIGSVLEIFKSTAKLKNCKILWEPNPNKIFMRMSFDPFSILLSNILINAGDATQNRGTIEIESKIQDKLPHLIIKDNGVGMSPETIKQIFEPYFTTKELGRGTGLGMFVVKQIIDSYQIKLDIQSEVGKGSSFDFKFNQLA